MLQIAAILSFVFYCLGCLTVYHFENYEKQKEALEQSEARREAEVLANRNTARITDALTSERLASERVAADAANRLRVLAASSPIPPDCPGRNDDPRPAAAVVHDDVREDLVALVRIADANSDRLRACQAELIQVCKVQIGEVQNSVQDSTSKP